MKRIKLKKVDIKVVSYNSGKRLIAFPVTQESKSEFESAGYKRGVNVTGAKNTRQAKKMAEKILNN